MHCSSSMLTRRASSYQASTAGRSVEIALGRPGHPALAVGVQEEGQHLAPVLDAAPADAAVATIFGQMQMTGLSVSCVADEFQPLSAADLAGRALPATTFLRYAGAPGLSHDGAGAGR